MPILITGAFGNVGRELVKRLQMNGQEIKAAVLLTEKERAREAFGSGIPLVEFDFTKPETLVRALEGVDRVFLMRPPAISDVARYIKPFVDLMVSKPIKHLVFLSLLGAEKNPIVPHYKIEKYILKSDIPYTFLRPSFFMQNLSGTHKNDIKLHNQICVPAGKGKTSFIDCRDIATAAAVVLTNGSHYNKAYSLTGPEAIDYYQVAEIFTQVLGRQIIYLNPGSLQFRANMKSQGYENDFITVMQGIYLTVKLGLAKRVTLDVPELLGRPAISINQFIEDYAGVWNR